MSDNPKVTTPEGIVTPQQDAYVKAKEQIAQLELELAEFRATSRNLERELELELEEAEEQHRISQDMIVNLTVEVDQWKVCL